MAALTGWTMRGAMAAEMVVMVADAGAAVAVGISLVHPVKAVARVKRSATRGSFPRITPPASSRLPIAS